MLEHFAKAIVWNKMLFGQNTSVTYTQHESLTAHDLGEFWGSEPAVHIFLVFFELTIAHSGMVAMGVGQH